MTTVSDEQIMGYVDFAEEHLKKWGLYAMGWRFEFIRSKRKLGHCRPSKKLIGLSIHYARILPKYEAEDTILHEIAHALAPGDKHGRIWKSKCREVGANPNRLYDGDVQVEGRYKSECCNKMYYFHRKLSRKNRCPSCHEILTVVDTQTNKPIEIKPKYKATCPCCHREFFKNRLGRDARYHCARCGFPNGKLFFKRQD